MAHPREETWGAKGPVPPLVLCPDLLLEIRRQKSHSLKAGLRLLVPIGSERSCQLRVSGRRPHHRSASRGSQSASMVTSLRSPPRLRSSYSCQPVLPLSTCARPPRPVCCSSLPVEIG